MENINKKGSSASSTAESGQRSGGKREVTITCGVLSPAERAKFSYRNLFQNRNKNWVR